MSERHLQTNDAEATHPAAVAAALTEARTGFREDPRGTLEIAIRAHARASTLGDAVLSARALALEGQVALHRGDVRSGMALAL